LKKPAVFILICLSFHNIQGQDLSNKITKRLIIDNDTVKVDSLSIVPETFSMSLNGSVIDKKSYTIDNEKSRLYIKDSTLIRNKAIVDVVYRRFGFDFYKPYSHKTFDSINAGSEIRKKVVYVPGDGGDDFFSTSQINTSGSISRGIAVGNNQDASVNSDFNLQISGNISPDISITGTISDDNIPIQADGTSQHLREFNKVYLELKTKQSKLIAGDFEISSTEPYFIKYKKNVKGLGFQTEFNSNPKFKLKSSIHTTLSKGKYNKLKIQGIEANQGPYKLTGANNELYVVVLSGSERIFVDGKLLQRGAENDYTIDYNTAELTFTVRQIITKDTRIIAEYEYTEQNYARFSFGSDHVFTTGKSELFFRYFSEYDAKNQNLRQDLTDEQKLLLNTIGDDLNSALVPNVVLSEDFSGSDVVYRKTDTLVSGVVFPDVYVFSTDTFSTTYVLGFSYVGENKGNYVRQKASINGKVFQWVAPISGVPQGNYEPVRQLISPMKKQSFTFGGKTKTKSNLDFNYELSLSDHDLNLFSKNDDGDNYGFAYKAGIEKTLIRGDSGQRTLNFALDYMYINRNFNAFETFRKPEFEREWNLSEHMQSFQEHLISFKSGYQKGKSANMYFESQFLNRPSLYMGIKNNLDGNFQKDGYELSVLISLLGSEDTVNTSNFVVYSAKLKKALKWFTLGVEDKGERNAIKGINGETWSPLSYRFNQFEAYIETPHNKEKAFRFSYINREDFVPQSNHLAFSSNSNDLKLSGVLLNTKTNRLKTTVAYRRLSTSDSLINLSNSGNSLAGNFEYALNLFKGTLSSSSFIEHASGNEFYNEYTYIEVNTGQGYYTWIDFNANKLKEINEFVKANFIDEASFIKISLPSERLQRVYNQSFNQTFHVIPRRIWNNEQGLKKIVSMFSDQFNFKMMRKISEDADYLRLFVADSGILSKTEMLKNTVQFELPKPNLKIAYVYSMSITEALLVNGNDMRHIEKHEINLIKKQAKTTFSNSFMDGTNRFESEFFPENDFKIDFFSNNSAFMYKPGSKTELKVDFTYTKKENLIGEENSITNNIGAEINHFSGKDGNIVLAFNCIDIRFNGLSNSAVSYEMTEGLSPGTNYVWSVLWYKKLNDYLQLELRYSGRKPGENPMIHTGSINLRAIF
jgi:hypothetical protein